jgi:predicted signal transduction protein with EAL and GGDEF domain
VATKSSEIPVTVSIGATVAICGATTETDLVAAADAALYEAKNSGRNRIVLSDTRRQISPASLHAAEGFREAGGVPAA